MAYRRRQQGTISKPSTLEEPADEGTHNPPPSSSSLRVSVLPPNNADTSFSSSPSSLAAKAIRASSAGRDSSLSSAYGHSYASRNAEPAKSAMPSTQSSHSYEYTSFKSLNETKQSFWGVLAQKAKAALEDDNVLQHSETSRRMGPDIPFTTTEGKYQNTKHLEENRQKKNGPSLLKGFDAITSSLSHIGGTIGNAFEEGLTKMENRTSDIIQETRKHIRKKPNSSEGQNWGRNRSGTSQQTQLRTQVQPLQTDQELQLKASRDVAMAMAAKAKLLLRELKTVKADLAFAKERCAQLEEENRILRENRERGENPDDDLIRLQLETLLAEKARLAHENSVYARENRFLREVVEYHQLTMQDVVYFDESNEEVTEVYPINFPAPSNPQPSSAKPPAMPSASLLPDISANPTLQGTKDIFSRPSTERETK